MKNYAGKKRAVYLDDELTDGGKKSVLIRLMCPIWCLQVQGPMITKGMEHHFLLWHESGVKVRLQVKPCVEMFLTKYFEIFQILLTAWKSNVNEIYSRYKI